MGDFYLDIHLYPDVHSGELDETQGVDYQAV